MRTAAIGLSLVLIAAAGGCRHYGGDWGPDSPSNSARPTTDGPGVEVLVIGQPRSGRSAELLAPALARQLDANARANTPTIVAWLASDLGPRGPERSGTCPSQAPTPPALAALLDHADPSLVSAWGLPGPDLSRCGLASAPEPNTLPYQQPGLAYVVRVDADGSVGLASRCSADHCELAPASGPVRVELVFLDLSFWVFPGLTDAARTAAILDQQRSLLEALAAAEPAPRVLISPIPIESAGTRGLGGRRQRTSFRYLPEPVQAAIAAGMFIGSVGALDRDLQYSADLSDAILRGARRFIDRPLFAVHAGSAGGPGHTLPTSQNGALLPDVWSERLGYARIHVGADAVEISLHARCGGRWRTTSTTLPLDRPANPPLRPTPTIQPCPGCDPQRGAADGEVFVPRTSRPR
jgi:hypothetical protein